MNSNDLHNDNVKVHIIYVYFIKYSIESRYHDSPLPYYLNGIKVRYSCSSVSPSGQPYYYCREYLEPTVLYGGDVRISQQSTISRHSME